MNWVSGFATALAIYGGAFMALTTGSASAADEKGNFAISGAGGLSCAEFVEAKDNDPERYRLFGSWMSGFYTGFNAIKDETYDIIPRHSPDLIGSIL